MDPFLVFVMVVLAIVTAVLVAVGIYLLLILRNLNKTLTKVNQIIDVAEKTAFAMTHPLTDIKSLGQGIKTGLFAAEYIVSWLKNKKRDQQDEDRR